MRYRTTNDQDHILQFPVLRPFLLRIVLKADPYMEHDRKVLRV